MCYELLFFYRIHTVSVCLFSCLQYACTLLQGKVKFRVQIHTVSGYQFS